MKMKDYIIYKLQYIGKDYKQTFEQAAEYNRFLRKLIDAFAPENCSEIGRKYTFWSDENLNKEYKEFAYKGHLVDTREIGLEMLWETHGIINNMQWRSMYIYIPIIKPKIIEFVEQNKPDWVTTVKRMGFPNYVKYN